MRFCSLRFHPNFGVYLAQSPDMKLNIIVADDHSLFRKAIKNLLLTTTLAESVHEASNGKEVLEILKESKVQLILLDVKMPVMDGFDTAVRVSKQFPSIKIVMLSTYDEESLIFNFIKIGISGYMLKNDDQLEEAIQTVMLGSFYFSKELKPIICKAQQTLKNIKPVQLSSREARLLPLLAKGKNSDEIARELSLTKHTVESYRKDLLAKFGVSNCTELVDYAHRTGLL